MLSQTQRHILYDFTHRGNEKNQTRKLIEEEMGSVVTRGEGEEDLGENHGIFLTTEISHDCLF